MPQQQQTTKNKKKKKKGHTPAHQNQFAFRHNPKSKLTAKILESPNVHVCYKCHEKIEWRKRYRKYKPRTKPGKCNLCERRNIVKAAYHTICESCTRSDKAKAFMRTKKREQQEEGSRLPPPTDDGSSTKEIEILGQVSSSVCNSGEANEVVVAGSEIEPITPSERRTSPLDTDKVQKDDLVYRVCAICVREPALPDDDDNRETTVDDILAKESRRVSLRERKRIERQLEREKRQAAEAKQAAKEARREERRKQKDAAIENSENNDDETSQSEDDDDSSFGPGADDAGDPFLHAVGGKEKLLVGDAYRERLLNQQNS